MFKNPRHENSWLLFCLHFLSLKGSFMKIEHKNIVLRDMTETDIEDNIRWNTVETEWALWDAPWEMEDFLKNFDQQKYREDELAKLVKPKDDPRWGFELDTADGTHIGSVNSYLIDESYSWVALKDVKEGQKTFRTVGIEISEPAYWNRGFGRSALAAFIKYYLSLGEKDIFTQTWSGNLRMIRCALRLGFEECNREAGFRKVRGGTYDGLTFHLNNKKFEEFLNTR